MKSNNINKIGKGRLSEEDEDTMFQFEEVYGSDSEEEKNNNKQFYGSDSEEDITDVSNRNDKKEKDGNIIITSLVDKTNVPSFLGEKSPTFSYSYKSPNQTPTIAIAIPSTSANQLFLSPKKSSNNNKKMSALGIGAKIGSKISKPYQSPSETISIVGSPNPRKSLHGF